MKKTLLSAAAFAVVAVSAVSIAPTTSEAIPAFARQTGAACLSCHFQSFPALASFGRSFKEGAFTDVGEQALIEDDNLSLPSSLNMSLMFRPQFNYSKSTGVAPVTGSKAIAATADQVLMIGGRIGENTGAFVEVGFGGGAVTNAAGGTLTTPTIGQATTAGGGFNNQQLLHSIDLGDGKLILSYYNTSFGEDAGLQLMSVWGQHSGVLAGGGLSINGAMSGAQTVGVSASYANEMGAITLGAINNTAAVGTNWSLAPMLRAQGFFDLAGAELGLGAIVVNGTVAPITGTNKSVSKRIGLSVQVQGEMGDTSYGIYADYANASASSISETNTYNAGYAKRDGYSIRATVKPVHNIIAMIGIGSDKVAPAASTATVKTTKFATGIEYELYQNAVINLTYDNSQTSGTTTKNYGLDFEFLM